MKMRLDSARMLLYQGAYQRSLGKSAFLEAAMTKVHLSDCWVRTCEDAIQVHGASGYMVEYEFERELRDALASKLYSGTSEIQRVIISQMLGV
jgi:alkylation response protein AidB-like acyl-CoA dehydrogenase